MIESKKCKGQGKAKSVKGCGKMVQVAYRKYGLCQSCYAGFILNTDYGMLLLERATLKATKPRKDLEKASKERKERNGLTTLLESVKTACHKYIRLRDKGKPCISCGHPYHSDHQAGHFYKAELFSSLKYNEYNINGQCQKCNLRMEGNESQYRVNLPYRIGMEKYRELEQLADLEKKQDFKWDREELKKIRSYYNQKIKELK